MFRSGLLTQRRVEQIVKRAEATPHNLRIVAKACSILPQDLLAWFAAGQDPACTNPQMVDLAWRINCLRADVAARNYARIEAAANGGTKRKRVVKADAAGVVEAVEEHVETVLPAAWAIEKIDALAAASHWEISPDAEQAAELHRMMKELTPTPLLTEVAGIGVVGNTLVGGGPLVGGNGGGAGGHRADDGGGAQAGVMDDAGAPAGASEHDRTVVGDRGDVERFEGLHIQESNPGE